MVLRLRSDDDGTADSTVTLRSSRQSQLTKDWTRDNGENGVWEYRIQGGWAGPGRVLAASCVTALLPDSLAVAVAAGGDPSVAFGKKQGDFLAACAPIRINVGALEPLARSLRHARRSSTLAGSR
jgi:hypothetical protein